MKAIAKLSILFLVLTSMDVWLNGLTFDMCTPCGVPVWFWSGVSIISYWILFLLLGFLLGGKAKSIYTIWYVWVICYLSLSWMLAHYFKRPLSGEIIQMITTTNLREIKEFLGFFANWNALIFFAALLAVIFLGIRLIANLKIDRIKLRISLPVSILGIGLFVYCNLIAVPVIRSSLHVGYFYWPVLSVIQYRGLYLAQKAFAHPDLPERISSYCTSRPLCGVIWIGESATRSRFGLYGYEGNKTTPRLMNCDNVFVFNDLVGCVAGTVSAYKWLFTDADMSNNDEGSQP